MHSLNFPSAMPHNYYAHEGDVENLLVGAEDNLDWFGEAGDSMVGATSVSSMASMIDSSDMSSCSSDFSGNSSDSEKAMDSVDEFLEEVRARAGISHARDPLLPTPHPHLTTSV